MPSIVTVSGVSFDFPNGRHLFHNLNFSIDKKITALVGPNGVGKTCLAKLLSGELQPSSGKISRATRPYHFSQHQEPPSISVEEFLAQDYEWSLFGERLLQGVDQQTLCSQLSGGEWMRVRLSRAAQSDFLILDEPTNDLDQEGRAVLLEFLREGDKCILLISHDRGCLSLCHEVLELSNQGLSKFGGGWDIYEEAKKVERDRQKTILDQAKQERDLALVTRNEQKKKQEKRNRQGAAEAARGGMPKILIGARKRRAQATTGRIDASTMENLDERVRDAFEAYEEMKIDPGMYADFSGAAVPAQKLVVEALDFNIRFQRWLFARDLTFQWRGNVRIAIKGNNGSGKSSLLKAILGQTFETRGMIKCGNLVTLAIDQRCSSLDNNKSVLENVRDVSVATESELRSALARFLFTGDRVFQKVGSLSGGERLRTALARGLLSNRMPELMILDEPTNNLDLGNIQFLENRVKEFRGAIIVVSHDPVFLKNCGVTEELVL